MVRMLFCYILFFFFFFSISNDKFFYYFFLLLDILLVELVCKFIVIKKINFYKLLNFFNLFNRGMKINLHKLHFLSSYFSSQPNKKNFNPFTFPPLQLNILRENYNLFYLPTFHPLSIFYPSNQTNSR